MTRHLINLAISLFVGVILSIVITVVLAMAMALLGSSSINPWWVIFFGIGLGVVFFVIDFLSEPPQ